MSSIEKAIGLLEDDQSTNQKRHRQDKIFIEPEEAPVEKGASVETSDKTVWAPPPTNSSSDKAEVAAEEVCLDFKALERAGYLIPTLTEGRQVEEYRLLKRQVLLNVKGQESTDKQCRNLIAVCSPSIGEGKTFTAFNLAMSIATEWDKTVLLVDCDLTRRSLTELVKLQKARGLTDALLDSQTNLDGVIAPTNVPKLQLMPAGRRHSGATELLASEKMRNILNKLSTQASDRIVLFDTPPLLSSSQAVVLLSLVGQSLLVVEEGKTTQKNIKEAITLLQDNKTDTRAIGIVLNKAHKRAASNYYY